MIISHSGRQRRVCQIFGTWVSNLRLQDEPDLGVLIVKPADWRNREVKQEKRN
jgi:hypothetical protein